MNWHIHLAMDAGASRIGPFSQAGAEEMLRLMVDNRSAQGYQMLEVSPTHYRSRTHQMEIWAEEAGESLHDSPARTK